MKSWLLHLISTVVSFLIGGVWFALLFEKKYLKVMGRETAPKSKPAPMYLVGPLLCNFVSITTNAVLMQIAQVTTFSDALFFGTIVAFGYIIATCMNIAINPNFPHPFQYTMLNAPYFLLTTLLSAAILFWMQ